jgi:hypothetical protein
MISLGFEQGRDDLAYRLFVIDDKDLGFAHLLALWRTGADASAIIEVARTVPYYCSARVAEIAKYAYAHGWWL